jgi:hypothetical protein
MLALATVFDCPEHAISVSDPIQAIVGQLVDTDLLFFSHSVFVLQVPAKKVST